MIGTGEAATPGADTAAMGCVMAGAGGLMPGGSTGRVSEAWIPADAVLPRGGWLGAESVLDRRDDV